MESVVKLWLGRATHAPLPDRPFLQRWGKDDLRKGGSSASPEGPVRGEELDVDLGDGANDLDWLLAGAEDRHGKGLAGAARRREAETLRTY